MTASLPFGLVAEAEQSLAGGRTFAQGDGDLLGRDLLGLSGDLGLDHERQGEARGLRRDRLAGQDRHGLGQIAALRLKLAPEGHGARMLGQGAGELRLGFDPPQAKRHTQGRRPGLRPAADGQLDAAVDAAEPDVPVQQERPPQRFGGELDVDLLDLLVDALQGVAVDQGAVADGEAVEADVDRKIADLPRRRRPAGLVPAGLAATGLALAVDIPIAPTVPEHLQQDHGLDQLDCLDPHVAAQERQQLDADLQRLDPRHVLRGAPGDVRQADVGRGKARGRNDLQVDVPLDREGTAGRLLELGGDLGLVRVPIDQARPDQHHRDGEHDQAEKAIEDVLHRCSPRHPRAPEIATPSSACRSPAAPAPGPRSRSGSHLGLVPGPRRRPYGLLGVED